MDTVHRDLLHEDVASRVYWNAAAGCVELETNQLTTSRQFRASMDVVPGLISEKKAHKLLADGSGGIVSDAEDLRWTEVEWLPRCLKAGVTHVAVVMPKSLAGHMSIDKMAQRTAVGPVTRRFFGSKEEAREWLSKQ